MHCLWSSSRIYCRFYYHYNAPLSAFQFKTQLAQTNETELQNIVKRVHEYSLEFPFKTLKTEVDKYQLFPEDVTMNRVV